MVNEPFAFVSADDFRKVSPKRSTKKLRDGCTLHSTTTYEIRDKHGNVVDKHDTINADVWFDDLVMEVCDYYELDHEEYVNQFYSKYFEDSQNVNSWDELHNFEQLIWTVAEHIWQNS